MGSLLPCINYDDWRESLLISISMDHDDISGMMIDSPQYEQYKKFKEVKRRQTSTNSKFPADLTPLMLASIRNQFGIVKKLLDRGETIPVPHHAYCNCINCMDALANGDELEVSKIRLYTYRGLTSDCYVTLTSTDLILEAFQLRQTLISNAEIEKYFKVSSLEQLLLGGLQ